MKYLILCVVFSVTIATHNAASIGQSGTANEGQTATKENLKTKLQEWFRALGSEKQERRENELNVDGHDQEESEHAPLSGQDKKEVLANKLQGLLKTSLQSLKKGETKRVNGQVKTGAVDRKQRERFLLQKIRDHSGRALSRKGGAAMFKNQRASTKSIRNSGRSNLKNARQHIQRGLSGVGKMAERSGRQTRGQNGQVQQKRMNVFGARNRAVKTATQQHARRNFRQKTHSSSRQMKHPPSARATGISKSHNTRDGNQKESVNRKQNTVKRDYHDTDYACYCHDIMYYELGYNYDPDLENCYFKYGNVTGAFDYCNVYNDYTYYDSDYPSCDSCYNTLYAYYNDMYMYDNNVNDCEMEYGYYYGQDYDSYCNYDYSDYNYYDYTGSSLTCEYCSDIINGNINDYNNDLYNCEMQFDYLYYSSCSDDYSDDYPGYPDGSYYPTNQESWGGTYNTSCDVPCMMEYEEDFYVCLLVEIYESTQELGEYSYMDMYVSPERYDELRCRLGNLLHEAKEKINGELMMHKPTDSGTGYPPYTHP